MQLMAELKRGSTTTLSPDLLGEAVSYRKNLGLKHAWSFTVDLKNAGANIRAMITNLETAMASEIWIPFVFRDTTKETSQPHYVQIVTLSGRTGVGPDYDSQYDVHVVEV